jgi:hypothetical protein
MSMQSGRTAQFERNSALEALLGDLRRWLLPSHEGLLQEIEPSDAPMVFVIGAPRSGTTLMVQWLAASGCFSYPSNLISRFFGAPTVGALMHKLLCDPEFQHGEELRALQASGGFQSDLGKTSGPAAPHEFWYFWRRFLPTVDIEPLGDRLDAADFDGLRAELRAMATLLGRPFCCKGMMIQYDLPAFARAVPEARFLFVHRRVDANAASLLRARRRFFGDEGEWYSAKPPGHEDLLQLSPEEQVREQVERTNDAIRAGSSELDPSRWTEVSLEAFLAGPEGLWSDLVSMMQGSSFELPPAYPGPPLQPQD